MTLTIFILVGFAGGVIAAWAALRWKAIAPIGGSSPEAEPATLDPRPRNGSGRGWPQLGSRRPPVAAQAEQESLRARLVAAESALAQAQERLATLDEAHDRDALRRETQLSDRRRIEGLQAQLAARETQLAELETEVSAQRRRLDAAPASSPDAGPAVAALRSALERSQAQVAERDARLARRDAEVVERDADLARRDLELAERDRRITAAEGQRDLAVESAAALEVDRHELAIVRGRLAETLSQRDEARAAAAAAAMTADELALARERLAEAASAGERLRELRLELDATATALEDGRRELRERDDRLDELARRLALAESRLADEALDSGDNPTIQVL